MLSIIDKGILTKHMSSEELAHSITRLTLTKKAEDVVILDLRKLTNMTDFFVICSGETDIQVKAITDAVLDGLVEQKIKPWHKEGYDTCAWVLLDFVDVVAHIFHKNSRSYYQLEGLWGDAPVTTITDTINEIHKE